MERIFFRVREVAEQFGLEDSSILRWIYRGKLPALKVGRAWRIPRAALVPDGRESAPAGDVLDLVAVDLAKVIPEQVYIPARVVKSVLRCTTDELEALSLPHLRIGSRLHVRRTDVLEWVIQQIKECVHEPR